MFKLLFLFYKSLEQIVLNILEIGTDPSRGTRARPGRDLLASKP